MGAMVLIDGEAMPKNGNSKIAQRLIQQVQISQLLMQIRHSFMHVILFPRPCASAGAITQGVQGGGGGASFAL